MPNYDLTNLALQIAAPNNVLLYDEVGDPSVMVRIPKFKISDVITGGSDSTHPAFIVNGVEKDSIYISKYQNIVNNGRAYSLPMQDPAVSLNFDQAWGYCKAKGPGWHLMTNAEWAAVALWCKKNGFMPKGNNNYGKDTTEGALPQKALMTYSDNGSRICRTATGSGFKSWYHDNTESGIADLNGNVWEWSSGLRLNGGEIQILPNNDAADWNNPVTAASSLWKAIMPDGSLVAPGTAGTLKWDYTTTPAAATASIQLSTTVDFPQSNDTPYGYKEFQTLTAKAGVSVPMLLKALGLFPADVDGYEGDRFWFRNNGERLPRRGGYWSDAANAGVFALYLSYARSIVHSYVGFRAAFCSL